MTLVLQTHRELHSAETQKKKKVLKSCIKHSLKFVWNCTTIYFLPFLCKIYRNSVTSCAPKVMSHSSKAVFFLSLFLAFLLLSPSPFPPFSFSPFCLSCLFSDHMWIESCGVLPGVEKERDFFIATLVVFLKPYFRINHAKILTNCRSKYFQFHPKLLN